MDGENEITTVTNYNLIWVCSKCQCKNEVYDIIPKKIIRCSCKQCHQEYEYYL